MANAVSKTIEQEIAMHLIGLAMEHKTTNYSELAEEFGLPQEWPQLGSVLSPILYDIFNWCEKLRMPKLTVLVVRRSGADMMLPGRGFWSACGMENLSRKERINLTEMFTGEVYRYFDIGNVDAELANVICKPMAPAVR